MSDKDLRQLQKMLTQIESYRARGIPLKTLIDGLEFLLSHVDGAEQTWRQEMLSKLGVLEDTYAVALDKSGGDFSGIDIDRITTTVGKILELVNAQLERTPSDE